LTVVALCLVVQVGATAAPDLTAHQVVDDTTRKVMDAVRAAPAYVEKDPQRYQDAIQSILDPVIDFRGFARGVMGAYATSDRYRSLDEAGRARLTAQLDRFTEVIRVGLVRTYSKGLLAFGGSRIQLSKPAGDEAKARTVSVEQLIFSDESKPYVVMYQMGRDRSGDWKLRNMIIETVNLGAIYRSQFESAARKYNGDLDRVIDNWSTSTADLEVTDEA
jgi:phospholipid transport system substrate-binding protein